MRVNICVSWNGEAFLNMTQDWEAVTGKTDTGVILKCKIYEGIHSKDIQAPRKIIYSTLDKMASF